MFRTATGAIALAALLTTVSTTAMLAQTATTETEVEEGAEALVEGAEGAAEDAGQAIENAGEDVQQEVEEGAAEVEREVGDGAAEVEAEVEETEAEVTTEAVEIEPAEGGEVTTETVEAEEVEVPEGTPVEGQIYEQSMDSFLASTLLGANVLSTEGEDVGEVNDVILSADGSVEGVVVGVGGFLGLGEKDVAVEFDAIEVQQDADTNALSFVLDATEEELDAAPEFRTRAAVEAEAEADAAIEAQPGGDAPTGDGPEAEAVVIEEAPAEDAEETAPADN